MKVCSKCKEEKSLDSFYTDNQKSDRLTSKCKPCNKVYYKEGKEAKLAYNKLYYEKNKQRMNKMSRQYYHDNRDHLIQMQVTRQKERYHSDPTYRIVDILRSRMNKALDGNSKSASTIELLGCTPEQWRGYIESLFTEGMGWNQRGLWHLDHHHPLAAFDLTDPIQQKYAFHWSNTSPMWAEDNLRKSDKYCPKELEDYLKSTLPEPL